MPLWLIPAWRFLKPLLPYIVSALVVLGLVYGAYSWAYDRGKAETAAKYQPVMQRATDRVNHALAVLKSADDTMKVQSASIRAQASAQTAALTNAYKQIAEADKRDVSRKAQIQRLTTVAAQPINGAPCDLPDELKDDWK